jgi:hypothetical protein
MPSSTRSFAPEDYLVKWFSESIGANPAMRSRGGRKVRDPVWGMRWLFLNFTSAAQNFRHRFARADGSRFNRGLIDRSGD